MISRNTLQLSCITHSIEYIHCNKIDHKTIETYNLIYSNYYVVSQSSDYMHRNTVDHKINGLYQLSTAIQESCSFILKWTDVFPWSRLRNKWNVFLIILQVSCCLIIEKLCLSEQTVSHGKWHVTDNTHRILGCLIIATVWPTSHRSS